MLPSPRRLDTPLGEIEFSVTAQNGAQALAGSILVVPIEPRLPQGMVVAGCHAAVLHCTLQAGTAGLTFAARWVGAPPPSHGPDSGQGLDAQRWRDATHAVLIGTEDAELLALRWPSSATLRSEPYPIEYSPQGLAIGLARCVEDTTFSLHFVVAWAALPEQIDASCWYAVDQPHAYLLDAIGLLQANA